MPDRRARPNARFTPLQCLTASLRKLLAANTPPQLDSPDLHTHLLEERIRVRSAARLERTCAHEAGHALMLSLLPSLDRCTASIVPAPGENGHVSYPGTGLNTQSGLLFDMQMSLAGREAERLLIGERGTGSRSDLDAFEEDARDWCAQQDDGPPLIRIPVGPAEARHNALLLQQIRRDQAMLVRAFLTANRPTLHRLVAQLKAQSTLEEKDLAPLLSSVVRTPGLAVIPMAVFPPMNSDGLESQIHRMHGLGLHPAKRLELSAPALKEPC